MLSFIAFLVATVFFFCAAVGAHFGPANATGWGLCLVALGLTLQTAPAYVSNIWANR